MNGRDIAGFYFDAEKNKYFKIQPNHSAPAGSPYTRENVKKVRNQKKQEREHNVRRQTLALEKVKRSSVLQSPWCAPKLQREHHGQSNRSRQLESSMLSAGFRHARRLASVSSNITACLRVDDFGGWFIGTKGEDALSFVNNTGRSPFWADPFRSSVLSIAQISRERIITTIVNDAGSLRMVTFERRLSPGHPEPEFCFADFSDLDIDGTIYCSASNGCFGAHAMVVHGTERRALIHTFNNDGQDHEIEVTTHQSDVKAADWLDAHTAILGHRNGIVQLFDIRTGGSSLRLKHPSSISKIRSLDSHKLIVAGIQNYTNMYDLRMPAIPDSRGFRQRRKTKFFTSEPVVCYDLPDNSDEYLAGLDLDISVATGILAATDDQQQINIFSLNYGHLLKRFRPTDISGNSPIRHLMFDHANDPEVLTFTCGNGLYRSSWGAQMDEG